MNKEQELKEELKKASKIYKKEYKTYKYIPINQIAFIEIHAELKGYQEARKEFERLIDKEIKVGCGVKLENIILGNKRKLIPDTCGEKGFLCFDCKQRLELKEQLKNQLRAGK